MTKIENNESKIIDTENGSIFDSSRILPMEKNIKSLAVGPSNSPLNNIIPNQISTSTKHDSVKPLKQNETIPKASNKRKIASIKVSEDKNYADTPNLKPSTQDSRQRKASSETPQLNKISSYFRKI